MAVVTVYETSMPTGQEQQIAGGDVLLGAAPISGDQQKMGQIIRDALSNRSHPDAGA
jgi:hypothetical protein